MSKKLEWDPRLLETAVVGQTIVPEALADTLAATSSHSDDPSELPRLTLKGPEALDAELRILSLLGRGGMGVVHLAHQRALGRDVAIKRVRPERSEPRVVADLLREARTVGNLEHPNIIPVYSLGADQDGQPVLVMKRVEGVVWKALIDDPQHRRWARIKGEASTFHLEVLRQVCRAMEFAHSRKILHRDLKAENVMIGEFGEVYVLDWGVAVAEGTTPSGIAGTPGFLAPEMVKLEPLDARTDVFLLGALLHEVLTGRPRFDGAHIAQVLYQSSEASPAEFPPSVPAELGEICNKACHKEPSQRFASAQEFREAIEAYLEHRSSMELVQLGMEHLQQLQRGLDAEAVEAELRERAAEGQLAFRGALRMWQDNPSARAGLDALLHAMARLELGLGNLDAARHLVEQLNAPPPRLLDALAQAERQAQAQEAELSQLKQQLQGSDLRIGATTRAGLFAAICLLGLSIVKITGALEESKLTHPRVFWLLSSFACLWAVITGVAWKKAKHRASFQIVAGIFLNALMFLPVQLLGWHAGVSLRVTILFNLLLTTLLSLLYALIFRPFWILGALSMAASVLVSVYFPWFWLESTMCGFVLLYSFTIWGEFRQRPDR